MTQSATPTEREVTCPHCRKQFLGALLGTDSRRGFKCPHCRLFVPAGRADELEEQPQDGA